MPQLPELQATIPQRPLPAPQSIRSPQFASRIWKSFDQADKSRFLRHLSTIWNIHLHRSCRQNIAVVTRLKETGRLEQVHARVIAVEKRGNHSDTVVRFVLRRGTDFTLDADAAVDGTGLFTTIQVTSAVAPFTMNGRHELSFTLQGYPREAQPFFISAIAASTSTSSAGLSGPTAVRVMSSSGVSPGMVASSLT